MSQAYEIYVPQNLNDGTAVDFEIMDGIIRDAIDIFGGATLGAEQMGYWIDNGRLYSDRIRVLTLFADSRFAVFNLASSIAVILDQVTVAVVGPDRTVVMIDQQYPVLEVVA